MFYATNCTWRHFMMYSARLNIYITNRLQQNSVKPNHISCTKVQTWWSQAKYKYWGDCIGLWAKSIAQRHFCSFISSVNKNLYTLPEPFCLQVTHAEDTGMGVELSVTVRMYLLSEFKAKWIFCVSSAIKNTGKFIMVTNESGNSGKV